ncbi:uncharacterized protein [Spinacia oleracea]|uniref:DUF4218 domain-containing protein n=1 Tax=Spinacia oleracea TaxID=3562 RepID=A0A9R0HRM0_SPIOL|nr:uncharacterized protein LOC110775348 [Spinacia oleracea]
MDEEDGDEEDRMSDMMDGIGDHVKPQSKMMENLNEAAKTPLYPGCTKFTKLSGTLELHNVKTKFGISDVDFDHLLAKFDEILPEGNTLPSSTYYAEKLMCPFGLDYVKIHACRNDCILYRKEYENLDKCPKCGESRYKRTDGDDPKKKAPPAKVIWYLPIIPRFRRLFATESDAKNLKWHDEGRKKDGLLRHPADSPQWRNIDRAYPEFKKEVRNLRLGLCTDGMNPYGTLSSQWSTWPVLLTIYNLPPWLCIKRKYLMLSLLISGPKQPGNDIDVYLAPLIDDSKLLWNEGVPMYDAHTKTDFTLRAMIFCTINDFPAYGNLSGYKIKGEKACPICEEEMTPEWLDYFKKNVYLEFRKFLPRHHPYRKKKRQFNGCTEERQDRTPLTGKQIYEKIKNIETSYGKCGKQEKTPKTVLWKKVSIFWDLPYWKDLSVRHCLDVMHIEKNVCDAIIGTLLNITGKTKDAKKVRLDLKKRNIRPELWPVDKEGMKKSYLPPACYTLSRQEKRILCECLYNIKVPSGYCANMKRLVSLTDLKLMGMKSHDCHVMMQVFLPVALRGILPKHVRHIIVKLCMFFNTISSKVIDPEKLDALQADIVETLCKLEMYFPPSFFEINLQA